MAKACTQNFARAQAFLRYFAFRARVGARLAHALSSTAASDQHPRRSARAQDSRMILAERRSSKRSMLQAELVDADRVQHRKNKPPTLLLSRKTSACGGKKRLWKDLLAQAAERMYAFCCLEAGQGEQVDSFFQTFRERTTTMIQQHPRLTARAGHDG